MTVKKSTEQKTDTGPDGIDVQGVMMLIRTQGQGVDRTKDLTLKAKD